MGVTFCIRMGGGSKRNALTYSLTHMPCTTGKKIGGGDGSNSTMHSGFPPPYIDMRWGMGWVFPKRENQWTGGQECFDQRLRTRGLMERQLQGDKCV